MKQLIFIGLLVILQCACNEKPNQHTAPRTSKYEAEVIVPAGELYESFDVLGIPTFFNVAEIVYQDNSPIKTILYGSKYKKGKSVSIEPFGKLSFIKKGQVVEYVLATDVQDTLIKDFELFMVQHHALKEATESWFKAQCESFECSDFNWSNAYKAILDIEEKALIQ